MRFSRALALLLVAGSAHADQGVDAQTFKPALDTYGVFATERAEGLEQWDFSRTSRSSSPSRTPDPT